MGFKLADLSMFKKNHQNRLLLNLYLINAGANMIGAVIMGALNLLTPTEFFKLWRNYFLDDGWIYILMMYPIIVLIGSGLQYLAQRPLKLYFKPRNSRDFNPSKIFRRARRRLLMLPPTISLLNISMWTGLSLLDASWMVLAKLIPSLYVSPLYSHSWHTIYFTLFRGLIIGCLAAGLALLLVEAYSRKHLIPVFFPEGRLAAHKKVWIISIRRRIQFLYFSGTVVPMLIFVGTLFYVEAEAGNYTVPVAVFGRDLLVFTISLYITFVLLSLWLNFLVGGSILEPIRDMIGTIRKVRTGDYTPRAQVVSNDEMGVLGDGINKMTIGLVQGEALRHSYNLAREIQLALLPGSPPVIEGLDIAARNVYREETGGDYFDFLQTPNTDGSQLNVIMGDACGLGISSALLMATCRAHLRQRTAAPGTPADIVADVNRQLVWDVEESCQFMALFYLTIDLQKRTLAWVRAGHNPAIFCDPATGTTEQLRGSGIVLGVDENWRYRQYDKPGLAAGQIIVLGTDGLWESLNRNGEMFGRNPVIRILNRYPDIDANGILTACLFALDRFRDGRPIEDDVSIVVIKVTN
jgi:serine phosphatase RsbU (regulator of sigma subunit)